MRDLELSNMEYLLTMDPLPPTNEELKQKFIKNVFAYKPIDTAGCVRKAIILKSLFVLETTEQKEMLKQMDEEYEKLKQF